MDGMRKLSRISMYSCTLIVVVISSQLRLNSGGNINEKGWFKKIETYEIYLNVWTENSKKYSLKIENGEQKNKTKQKASKNKNKDQIGENKIKCLRREWKNFLK